MCNNNISLALQNVRSLRVKDRIPLVLSELKARNLDILCLTETWLTSVDDFFVKNATPGFLSVFQSRSRDARGGGVGLIYSDVFFVSSVSVPSPSSFEHMSVLFSANDRPTLTITLIYRPPKSPTTVFLTEFEDYLECLCNVTHHIILGDFNFHVDNPSDSHATSFLEIIDHFGYRQHVNDSTHDAGHTLDLIMSRTEDHLLYDIKTHDAAISDHRMVTCTIRIQKKPRSSHCVYARKWKNFNVTKFEEDLMSCKLCDPFFLTNADCASSLLSEYNQILKSLCDIHAPLTKIKKFVREPVPWFNSDILSAIRVRRRLENMWRKTKKPTDRAKFVLQRNFVKNLVIKAKSQYYSHFVERNSHDSSSLWPALLTLLQKNKAKSFPSALLPEDDLAEKFSDFFIGKISNLRRDFPMSCLPPELISQTTCSLSCFHPVSIDDIRRIVKNMKQKSCQLDPIPTWLLKLLLSHFLPVLCRIVNISISTGLFPDVAKHAIVTPILKKSNLDKNIFSNYRPVSSLSFVAKLIERVVFLQIERHLVSNNLSPLFQSAYIVLYCKGIHCIGILYIV